MLPATNYTGYIMQIVKISSSFIFSAACTQPMLFELAQHAFVGYSLAAVEKLAAEQLKGASKGNGRTGKGASNGIGDLPMGKLRTCVVNKLDNNPDVADVFKSGEMEFEFNCLADLDMGTAGSNKTKRSTGPRTASAVGALVGDYVIVKQGVKCNPESDPGKYEIWMHVWNSSTFEQFFNSCPAKAVTKTGRVITARSEILWAIKSGWIKPVVAA
jgi:hypothetical protein